ncbi:BMA_0021/BMA_0022 family TOMM bacteriocin [Trinickia diaoshuihuensis]|jgi:ribosomally synthesized peptide (two-chain TOMM family)|uniref:BMA_0021/BMA_0022 family TOMM bacteriocin n=1 Tax=Trinickia diaoshuihuensis TaxID=2292265 RepID=UPI000E2383AF|nr:BMA_0021/BMA_0022 family TOMM bacteriocin [Trinickia diaoshuihuensis]
MTTSTILPSYDQFLEFRAVIIEAIALAWRDADFLGELRKDPKQALKDQFGYEYPAQVNLKVNNNTSTWLPDLTGGWKTNQLNALELVLPPAPAPDQMTVALAAYNAKHLNPISATER